MKKRNKPIILVTVLILLLGTVAFINAPKDAFARPPQAPPPTGEKVDVPDKDQIAADMSNTFSKKGTGKPMGGPRRPGPMGPDGGPGESGPAISVHKAAPYKPVPNDSSTSTQWYSQETPKDLPKK